MARYVLMDPATGTRIRHQIYTWSEAVRQKEIYEDILGRPVKVEKKFTACNGQAVITPPTGQDRRVAAFNRKIRCLICHQFIGRRCALRCRPGDKGCVGLG